MSTLDSVTVNRNVIGPTHDGSRIFDLVLTFGLSLENTVTLQQFKIISHSAKFHKPSYVSNNMQVRPLTQELLLLTGHYPLHLTHCMLFCV